MGSTGHRGRGSLRMQHRKFFILLFAIICIFLLVMAAQVLWAHSNSESGNDASLRMPNGRMDKEIVIMSKSLKPKAANNSCLFHTCFDVYHCGYNDENRISVYIYPSVRYLDDKGVPIILTISKEFHEILQTISDSIYYTSDPEKACLFVPPVDMLNQNHVHSQQIAQVLAALPYWNEGTNHLLFNMLPGNAPDYHTSLQLDRDRAVLAGGGFSTWSYRRTYDVSIPVYNPLVSEEQLIEKSHS